MVKGNDVPEPPEDTVVQPTCPRRDVVDANEVLELHPVSFEQADEYSRRKVADMALRVHRPVKAIGQHIGNPDVEISAGFDASRELTNGPARIDEVLQYVFRHDQIERPESLRGFCGRRRVSLRSVHIGTKLAMDRRSEHRGA